MSKKSTIPYEGRKEVVEAIKKYVDEVIPQTDTNKTKAVEKYMKSKGGIRVKYTLCTKGIFYKKIKKILMMLINRETKNDSSF